MLYGKKTRGQSYYINVALNVTFYSVCYSMEDYFSAEYMNKRETAYIINFEIKSPKSSNASEILNRSNMETNGQMIIENH